MFKLFQATTADDVWQNIAETFRAGGFSGGRGSRAGTTSEILHAAISIADPRQRWIVSRRPALNLAFALAEVVWIVRGRKDSAFLNYFNHELPRFAGSGVTYHGAYGYRLRSHFGFDQLERGYSALKGNLESRQVNLQIWSAADDFPDGSGRAVANDVPCNISSLLKVREGRLEWLQVMRSNDVFRGVPYNIVQFTALHEVLAGWLGLELGEYHHLSDSLHVYDDTADDIRRSLPGQCARSSDDLALPKQVAESGFLKLEEAVEQIIDPTSPAESLVDALGSDLPAAYRNIGLVLCAEGARRRKRRDLADRTMEDCTNPAYLQLYSAWLARTGSKV